MKQNAKDSASKIPFDPNQNYVAAFDYDT